MATVLAAYPQAKWHQYDPVSRDGARAAARRAAGAAGEAVYHFDKADVVVSLDADFLGLRPGQRAVPERLRRSAARHRRAEDDEPALRGREHAVADRSQGRSPAADARVRRRRLRAAARRGAIGAGSAPAPARATDVAKWVAAVAKDLQAHAARSLVVAGEYQPAAVHALAHAMNQALGNVGTTVTYGAGDRSRADRTGARRWPSWRGDGRRHRSSCS